MSKDHKQAHPEVGEDATQYGEFVCSYFAWIPLQDQKEKAEKMAKMTNAKKKDRPKFHKGDKVVWFINLLIKLKKL